MAQISDFHRRLHPQRKLYLFDRAIAAMDAQGDATRRGQAFAEVQKIEGL